MQIQRGTVAQMMGDTATVIPDAHPDIVTQPLVVPFYWRETMGNLRENEHVFFFCDSGFNGYIIGRCDGNWDNTLRGTLNVTDDIQAGGDVQAGGISLQQHKHVSSSPGSQSSTPQ